MHSNIVEYFPATLDKGEVLLHESQILELLNYSIRESLLDIHEHS
jgi:hypothetical protein